MLLREKGGVVDARFRVYSVRVMDSSMFPVNVSFSGHSMAQTHALAEMAAELILEDWKAKPRKKSAAYHIRCQKK
jgi:hypothetical protein